MFSTDSRARLSPHTGSTRQNRDAAEALQSTRPRGKFLPNPKARLRDQVHEVMRFFHYSQRTEETYWQWIVRYLRFHRKDMAPRPSPGLRPPSPVATGEGTAGAAREEGWRHPREMGAGEVHAFLSHLAMELQVSAATQNQALHPVR